MVTALAPHHVWWGMGYGAACLGGATWGSLRALPPADGVCLCGLPIPFDVGCRGSWRNVGETRSESSRREGGQIRPHPRGWARPWGG